MPPIVDFSYMDLSKLPNETGQEMMDATTIDLSHNQLDNYPQELATSACLSTIYLNDNMLRKINYRLILPKLRILSLANNHLTAEACDPLRDLKSLQELYLNGNKIRYVPSAVLYLQNLQKLSLSDNFIRALPRDFACLKSLRMLSLSRNNIQSIQLDIFSQMHNLKSLNIMGNPIPVISQMEYTQELRENIQTFGLSAVDDYNVCSSTSPPLSPLNPPSSSPSPPPILPETFTDIPEKSCHFDQRVEVKDDDGLDDDEKDLFDEFKIQYIMDHAPTPPPSIIR